MIAKQTTDALGNFYIIVACLRLAQPYINNCECREWFAESHIGLGKVVRSVARGTMSFQKSNRYMIEQYAVFNRACGSPCRCQK